MLFTSVRCASVRGAPIVARMTSTPDECKTRASSSEYVQTPPTVSAVIRTRRGSGFGPALGAMVVSASILACGIVRVDGIEHLRHFGKMPGLRIEARPLRQAPRPVHGCPAAPAA